MYFGKRGPRRSRWKIANMAWGGRWKAMERWPRVCEALRFYLQEDGGHQQVTDARRKAGDVLAIATSNDCRIGKESVAMARAMINVAFRKRNVYRRNPWWDGTAAAR